MGPTDFAKLVAKVEQAVQAKVIQAAPWRAVLSVIQRRQAATEGIADVALPDVAPKARRRSITMRGSTGIQRSCSAD